MTGSLTIAERLRPAIDRLLAHPLYERVRTVETLQVFMREHAFAVWDFMTLLKRLQQEFCGTRQPWSPPAHPSVARFINEIVLGEESDADGNGGFVSHFELYLSAMDELGAETAPIKALVAAAGEQGDVVRVLKQLPIRPETREFVNFNLQTARTGQPWEVASVFCFGREDVIPAMFQRLMKPLSESRLNSQRFEYYLQRHIDLDGDQHGPLANRLLQALINDSSQRAEQAYQAGLQAIELRIRLWDGILSALDH